MAKTLFKVTVPYHTENNRVWHATISYDSNPDAWTLRSLLSQEDRPCYHMAKPAQFIREDRCATIHSNRRQYSSRSHCYNTILFPAYPCTRPKILSLQRQYLAFCHVNLNVNSPRSLLESACLTVVAYHFLERIQVP